MSSNKKPVAKYRYRNVDVTKDIGKQIEVRDSTSSRWRKKIFIGIKNGSLYYYRAKDLDVFNETGWVHARIREEDSNGEDKFQEEPTNQPIPPQESSNSPPQQKPLQSHIDARFDCIDPVVMKLLAECLGYGAKKYFPYSYLRIPVEDHINHALNHINEHRRLGQDKTQKPEDELHLVNALARITFAISCLAKQGSYVDTYTHPELLANPISGGGKE